MEPTETPKDFKEWMRSILNHEDTGNPNRIHSRVTIPKDDATRQEIRSWWNGLTTKERTDIVAMFTGVPNDRLPDEPLHHFVWRRNLVYKLGTELGYSEKRNELNKLHEERAQRREASRRVPERKPIQPTIDKTTLREQKPGKEEPSNGSD